MKCYPLPIIYYIIIGKGRTLAEALYRKYRSKRLSEIVGQSHITDILEAALEQGKTSHAYLLTGPRGVGKTSIARILAHEINKLKYDEKAHLDIIEIDAASNNSVEDIRDLREKVSIAPVSAEKKIYIIDEVHMLSKPAFNALLKTLEEPPAHVVFILATTEIHKIPDTILSRTQRFHFRPIPVQDMIDHLKMIAKKESIKIDEAALDVIARRAHGSFRDAISILDQLKHIGASRTITKEQIEASLGLASSSFISDIFAAIIAHDSNVITKALQELEESGLSAVTVSDQLVQHSLAKLPAHPELITLIDELLEVQKSSNPFIKLFISIAKAASSKKASSSPPNTKPTKHADLKATLKSYDVAAPLKETAPKPQKKIAESTSPNISTIDWQAILKEAKKTNMTLYSIIMRAEASPEDDVLTLHFPYALHQKKIESDPYRSALTTIFISLYKTVPELRISSGKRSPKNEHAKAVAAIMGGGEEVYVSSTI